MEKLERTRILYAIALLVLLVIATTGVLSAQSGVNVAKFRAIVVEHFATINGDVTVGDDLSVADTLNVTGDTTLASVATLDALTVGTLEKWTVANAITVTNGAAFTPTGSYQPITAAGAVTPTLTVLAAGTKVCIVNTSTQNVLILDANTAKLTGDDTLAQFDMLCVISDGTNWLEVGRPDN